MRNRLKQAGLPLAYMYRGNVATQNSSPQLSIDPNLGTLSKIQGEKIKSDTKGQDIKNQVDQGELDFLKTEVTNPDGVKHTNQYHNLMQERNRKYAESFIKQYEKKLKQIELNVERSAFREGIPLEMKRQALQKALQQVKNLLAQAGLMDQLKKIRGFEEQMNESLTQDLDNLPDWISSLLKIILIATKR